MPRSQRTSQIIWKVSEGILSSVVDVGLVFVNFGLAGLEETGSYVQQIRRFDKRMEELNYETIKDALRRAFKKGWIDENFCITPEGRRRLQGKFLGDYTLPSWDGKWYIVLYDVPERLRRKRGALRLGLKTLGFGNPQGSFWISPKNFLGAVKELVEEVGLEEHVLVSISESMGTRNAHAFAERIWPLAELDKKYNDILVRLRKQKISRQSAFFLFQAVAKKDPLLPRELLPANWKGEKLWNEITPVRSS